MKAENKGNTVVLTDDQGDTTGFLMKLTHEHKTFADQNLIIDISSNDQVVIKSILMFKPLSKIHRKGKKSFVIVANGIDFNAVPADLTVVPTALEAHDIIEMEEIERDLGF